MKHGTEHMDKIKVLEVKQSVFANNDARANLLRKELKEKKVYLINLMSSPGSGKTTLLVALINRLKDKLRIGVMEADMDATVDAEGGTVFHVRLPSAAPD